MISHKHPTPLGARVGTTHYPLTGFFFLFFLVGFSTKNPTVGFLQIVFAILHFVKRQFTFRTWCPLVRPSSGPVASYRSVELFVPKAYDWRIFFTEMTLQVVT